MIRGLNFILILVIFLLSISISSQIEKRKNTIINKEYLFDLPSEEGKKTSNILDSLDPQTLLAYSKINSCYLPLVKDSTFFCRPIKKGFSISELYNDTLGYIHKYANRYLVADLMVLNDKMQSRGIKEINPELNGVFQPETEDSIFINSLLKAEESRYSSGEFKEHLNKYYPNRAEEIFNFYTKVWKYLTPPLEKKFTFYNDQVYAAGQKLCLCEIKRDTIEQVAQFAVSAKKFGSINSESVPIGDRRDYYASQYVITSKCWERDRKYEFLDVKHDQELGGGKKEVTYYKGGVELPNFLLMHPSKEFPEAVRMNGIHQLALRELSMASLGTANSLGCIRVSNFGSKFIRWWTPKFANLFIAYQDERYYKKFSREEVQISPPFSDSIEGNKFRKWLCHSMPDKAIQLNIDSTGDYQNGHILYAYNVYGKLYNSRTESPSQLIKLKPQEIDLEASLSNPKVPIESIAHHTEKAPITDTEITNEKEQIKTIKKTKPPVKNTSVIHPHMETKIKGLIILGSFKNENNALNFKKSLIIEGNENVKVSIKNSMYRVAVLEENHKEKILSRLKSFRTKYPDAWLVYLEE